MSAQLHLHHVNKIMFTYYNLIGPITYAREGQLWCDLHCTERYVVVTAVSIWGHCLFTVARTL